MLPIKVVRRKYRVYLKGLVEVWATSEDEAIDRAIEEAETSDLYAEDIEDLHEVSEDYEIEEQ
jgi:hypothetical protein